MSNAPTAFQTVRYSGGPLSGAVLELPVELVDAHPSRLVVTQGGKVYDRQMRRPVLTARIVELPTAMRPAAPAKPARRRRRA